MYLSCPGPRKRPDPNDHGAPHIAAIGPAHVLKYTAPSGLAANCVTPVVANGTNPGMGCLGPDWRLPPADGQGRQVGSGRHQDDGGAAGQVMDKADAQAGADK